MLQSNKFTVGTLSSCVSQSSNYNFRRMSRIRQKKKNFRFAAISLCATSDIGIAYQLIILRTKTLFIRTVYLHYYWNGSWGTTVSLDPWFEPNPISCDLHTHTAQKRTFSKKKSLTQIRIFSMDDTWIEKLIWTRLIYPTYIQ